MVFLRLREEAGKRSRFIVRPFAEQNQPEAYDARETYIANLLILLMIKV